jgi:hypothetical protein
MNSTAHHAAELLGQRYICPKVASAFGEINVVGHAPAMFYRCYFYLWTAFS